jgi:hypothetical protein
MSVMPGDASPKFPIVAEVTALALARIPSGVRAGVSVMSSTVPHQSSRMASSHPGDPAVCSSAAAAVTGINQPGAQTRSDSQRPARTRRPYRQGIPHLPQQTCCRADALFRDFLLRQVGDGRPLAMGKGRSLFGATDRRQQCRPLPRTPAPAAPQYVATPVIGEWWDCKWALLRKRMPSPRSEATLCNPDDDNGHPRCPPTLLRGTAKQTS